MKKKNKENPVVGFLSSVKLAVTLFILLALGSIAGTLLPQEKPLRFYMENYSPGLFKLIKGLHLYDTYHSAWYLALLVLFCLNLTVCITRRLPYTWKLWRRDPLDLEPERLLRMPFKASWEPNPSLDETARERLVSIFKKGAGHRLRQRTCAEGGTLYLSERGRWSYWGLYGLHFSLILIFVGAIVGNIWGFGGTITLAEGQSTDKAFSREDRSPIPLGFRIRCDKFVVKFYENGAPKLFRSDLTVIEDGKEVLKKQVVVNGPLSYKGIKFYQASYQAVPEVSLLIVSSDGREKRITTPAYRQVSWPEAGLDLGVMQYVPNIHGQKAVRLWIGSRTGASQAVWLLKNRDGEFNDGRAVYRISLEGVNDRFLTGLEVKKDPGVPIVYLGCIGLVLGILVAFWVPHRRLWLYIDGSSKIILAGQTNKNRAALERRFQSLREAIQSTIRGEKA